MISARSQQLETAHERLIRTATKLKRESLRVDPKGTR